MEPLTKIRICCYIIGTCMFSIATYNEYVYGNDWILTSMVAISVSLVATTFLIERDHRDMEAYRDFLDKRNDYNLDIIKELKIENIMLRLKLKEQDEPSK